MRAIRGKAAAAAALVLIAFTGWADEAPQARIQPPGGYTADARMQPPGGVTSNSRLQPPVGAPEPESRMQPPVGSIPEEDDAGFVDLLACWLRALLNAAD